MQNNTDTVVSDTVSTLEAMSATLTGLAAQVRAIESGRFSSKAAIIEASRAVREALLDVKGLCSTVRNGGYNLHSDNYAGLLPGLMEVAHKATASTAEANRLREVAAKKAKIEALTKELEALAAQV